MTVAVAHVGGELDDQLEREFGIAVGVEFADGFLSVTVGGDLPVRIAGGLQPVSLP